MKKDEIKEHWNNKSQEWFEHTGLEGDKNRTRKF